MNRDFKGVWIPKEIWLNTELTMLEKIILVEVSSLDNENHCIAGNEYFATFCNCSESKVSKAIKKLKELNLIEELSFDGRHRKLRVVKNAMQSSKKCYAESQKVQSNNIDNNTNNKKNNSKELLQDFNFGKQKKAKKDSLYTKCVSLIDKYDFANTGNVRKLLIEYLNYRLSVKDKPLYANMWKGILNKLSELGGNDILLIEDIIKQSIERGYLSFYPVKDFANQSKPWEEGVKSTYYTDAELEELAELDRERREKGLRTTF